MKTIQATIICFNQWKFNVLLLRQSDQAYFKFSVVPQRNKSSRYESQLIYRSAVEAYYAAFFFCFRAVLDFHPCPAMMVDLRSGSILSINLLAFELLSIDGTGLNILDFAGNSEEFENFYQVLQQEGRAYQTVHLQNADGSCIPCKVVAEIEPCYSKWAIFSLYPNQESPCHH